MKRAFSSILVFGLSLFISCSKKNEGEYHDTVVTPNNATTIGVIHLKVSFNAWHQGNPKLAAIQTIDKATAIVFDPNGDELVRQDLTIEDNRAFGQITVLAQENLGVTLAYFDGLIIRYIGEDSDVDVPAGGQTTADIEVEYLGTSISSPDSVLAGNDFTVAWMQRPFALNYEVQEATQPDFSNAITLYEGLDLSHQVAGKSGEDSTYYYRARVITPFGPGPWHSTGDASTGIIAAEGTIILDIPLPPGEGIGADNPILFFDDFENGLGQWEVIGSSVISNQQGFDDLSSQTFTRIVGGGDAFAQLFQVTPGQTNYLHVAYMTLGGHGFIGVLFFDEDRQDVEGGAWLIGGAASSGALSLFDYNESSNNSEDLGQWKVYTQPYEIPEGAFFAQIRTEHFLGSDPINQGVFFDNIEWSSESTPSRNNLIENLGNSSGGSIVEDPASSSNDLVGVWQITEINGTPVEEFTSSEDGIELWEFRSDNVVVTNSYAREGTRIFEAFASRYAISSDTLTITGKEVWFDILDDGTVSIDEFETSTTEDAEDEVYTFTVDGDILTTIEVVDDVQSADAEIGIARDRQPATLKFIRSNRIVEAPQEVLDSL